MIFFSINHKENKIDLPNNIYWIIFTAFFLLCLFLRVYKFCIVPSAINQDEAMAAVEAKSLLMYGTDRFGMRYPVYFTGWVYSQMNVLLSYIMTIFIKVFGFNIFAIRLPSLLFSLAGIIFLFLLIKNMFGKIFALITFIFCSVNPWHIMQSRWALEANLLPHVFIIALFFLSVAIKKSKAIFLYISMIFFGLCMYCYGISFYSVNIFLFICAIYLLKEKIVSIKEIILSVLIYFLISWPIYAVMFINAFGFETIKTPLFTIAYFPHQIRDKDILFFAENPILQIKTNFISFIKFLFQITIPTSAGINNFASMYFCSIPLLFLGIFSTIKRFFHSKNKIEKANIFFVLTNFFVGLFAVFITKDVDIYLNRGNFIFYSMIILISFGIFNLLSISKKFIYPIVLVYYVITFCFVHIYFNDYKDCVNNMFYYDFVEALDYTKQNNYDKIYITSTKPYLNSASISEILTLFCHDIDAKYFQGNKKINGKYYKEKYFYEDFTKHKITSQKNTAYIICEFEFFKQQEDFIQKNFSIKKFNRYYVLESLK